MNVSDAERLRTVLNSAKYQETTDEKSADLIVVVACSVRQTAIDRIHGKINMWKKWKQFDNDESALGRKNRDLKIALTGCVLPTDKKQLAKSFDIVFDIKKIASLPQMLAKKNKFSPFAKGGLKGDLHNIKNPSPTLPFIKGEGFDYFKIKPLQQNTFSASVPIMTGCDNFCTYCAVPFTRGREVSRPAKEIIAEVKDLIKNNYKDITLLGQNVNSYKPNFVNLVKQLDKIPGNYWIRFTSNHPKDFLPTLYRAKGTGSGRNTIIDFLKTSKHFAKYIHLPVQSGSDRILQAMKRPYKIADYIKLAQKIKKEIPEVCLTTDMIVGFPGETKADFKKSCDLFKKIKYDLAFISQYSPRPGTPAAKLKDNVSRAEKKRKELFLNKILAKTALENNKKLIGKTIKVLIEKISADKSYALARTSTLKTVKIFHFSHMRKVKYAEKLMQGEFAEVKITSVTPWKLEGVLVK
jgi:tRNA-2-methylthio-N6-dimethylallyladenosine synthase